MRRSAHITGSMSGGQEVVHRLLQTSPRLEIAIIGGGAAGAECVRALVEKLKPNNFRHVRITVYERSRQIGRGAAWAQGNATLICNMPARTLTVSPDQVDQIARAVGIRGEHTGSAPLPRSMVGDVLAERFQETCELASAAGIEVEHVQDIVVNILQSNHCFTVIRSNGISRAADYIVLALGNLPPTTFVQLRGIPEYHANPWNIRHILNVTPDTARVAILGTGPTSADLAIALSEWGHLGQITFYSRSGKLPWVRPRYDILCTPQILSIEKLARITSDIGPLHWPDAQRLLLKEAASPGITIHEIQRIRSLSDHLSPYEYIKAGIDESTQYPEWFTTLKRIDEILPYIWHALNNSAKDYVHEHVRKEHARLSYAIPSQNAERLLRLLEIDALQVRGGLSRVEYVEGSRKFRIHLAEPHRVDEADIVINATGLGTDIDKMDNLLVSNLRRSRMLSRNPFGGTNADFHTGEVIGEDGRTVDGLFALAGCLTIGVHGFVNALLKVSKSAIRTANSIVNRMATGDIRIKASRSRA